MPWTFYYEPWPDQHPCSMSTFIDGSWKHFFPRAHVLTLPDDGKPEQACMFYNNPEITGNKRKTPAEAAVVVFIRHESPWFSTDVAGHRHLTKHDVGHNAQNAWEQGHVQLNHVSVAQQDLSKLVSPQRITILFHVLTPVSCRRSTFKLGIPANTFYTHVQTEMEETGFRRIWWFTVQ